LPNCFSIWCMAILTASRRWGVGSVEDVEAEESPTLFCLEDFGDLGGIE
jgi:hypothetical protein